jgi:hypothetical protein
MLTVIAAFTPDSTTDESATDTSTDSGAGSTAKRVVG